MVYDAPGPEGFAPWIGEYGGTPGAVAVHIPILGVTLAVALTGEGSPEAVAMTIVRAIGE